MSELVPYQSSGSIVQNARKPSFRRSWPTPGEHAARRFLEFFAGNDSQQKHPRRLLQRRPAVFRLV
jgi:hypothetical protein